MLDAVHEAGVRATRSETNLVVDNRDIALQKIEKGMQSRPVESPGKGAASDTEADYQKKKGNYRIDENGVYYEKYDNNGNVIFRAPPEEKPIDEHV